MKDGRDETAAKKPGQADDTGKYFIYGDIRIEICEHFPDSGKPMESLLLDLIRHAAKQEKPEQIS